MSAARIGITLSVAVLLCGTGGDAGPWDATQAWWLAGARAQGAEPSLPRFALFGWISPPNEHTTAERIGELAGAGLNVALPAWADSGRRADNLRRVRLAAGHGVRCLAWDERFARLDFGAPSHLATLDSIVADYAGEPGFLGYYFTDEPQPWEFPLLAEFYSSLRARDPVHPAWNDLLSISAFANRSAWERYALEFVKTVEPSVLCNNHYDFLEGSDRGRFVENAAALRAVADEGGIPFWSIVQLVQHGSYRALTPGELRWQVSHLLAFGARGVGYFTYWTPAPDPKWNWRPAVIDFDGTRGPWYDVLAAFNPSVRAAGETLAGLAWLSTQHAGSIPRGGTAFVPDGWVRAVTGRAAIGRFAGAAGDLHLLVANSDSLAPRTVALSLEGRRRAWRLGAAAGEWSEIATEPELGGARLDLGLDAGHFALVRLGEDPAASPRPGLAVGPNPASGIVRFAVSRISPGARIEILDSQGRRIWSSPLVPNAGPLAWNGEREGGGRARPGIYHARVTDASGVASAPFSWLGAR